MSTTLQMRDVESTLETLLDLSKKYAHGAEASAHVHGWHSANTRYARNEITSSGDTESMQIRLELAFGKRRAESSTNQTDAASLRALVERTAAMAHLAPEDPELMAVLGPQTYAPAPVLFDDATNAFGAAGRLTAIEGSVAAAEGRSLDGAGFYEHWSSLHMRGTSAGLRAKRSETYAELTATARTKDGTGSGWGGAASHKADEIVGSAIGRTAAEKGATSKGPRRLEPGKYTVILEPAAVSELLQSLFWSLDARKADEGRSYFTKAGGGTRVGETLFPKSITLTSDPADPLAPGAVFDDDGVPLAPTAWIDQGTLKNLRYSRYWAAKQGKAATGFHDTLRLHGGDAKSPADLLTGVKRGLLITRFWYTRWLDPRAMLITGLTRDGVFLVENGAIVGPVNNFRFNESPANMLKNIDAMTAATVRTPGEGGHWHVPTIRTNDFNLASISDAV